jgi:hypothetical protein
MMPVKLDIQEEGEINKYFWHNTKKGLKGTVNIRKPDRPVFKWSFFGHFLRPDFDTQTKVFTSSLDRFVMNKIFFCDSYL